MLVPARVIVRLDQENDEMITSSSPIRLMEGGRARLARLASSHHAVISGRMVCSPRARIIVRLWIRS